MKELVENSIDANSKNIKIEIIEGGIQKIMVTDDRSEDRRVGKEC